MKIHLVDGTFELFRCFNGAPRATNDTGEEVGASRAFAHTLVSLLRQEDVTHVAVTFDTIVDAPLAPSGADGPWNQHSIAAEVTRALGVTLWPMIRRYEADDALAWALNRYGSIEAIPVDGASWDVAVRGAVRLVGTLAERRNEALLYRDLIDLATDVPVRETVDELAWQGADRVKLEAAAARIGAEDVLDRFLRWR